MSAVVSHTRDRDLTDPPSQFYDAAMDRVPERGGSNWTSCRNWPTAWRHSCEASEMQTLFRMVFSGFCSVRDRTSWRTHRATGTAPLEMRSMTADAGGSRRSGQFGAGSRPKPRDQEADQWSEEQLADLRRGIDQLQGRRRQLINLELSGVREGRALADALGISEGATASAASPDLSPTAPAPREFDCWPWAASEVGSGRPTWRQLLPERTTTSPTSPRNSGIRRTVSRSRSRTSSVRSRQGTR